MEANATNCDSNQSRLPRIAALTLALGFACWFALAVSGTSARQRTTAKDAAATLTIPNEAPPVHSGCLIEFTDDDDDSYMILNTHVGEGDKNRLLRNNGLEDSNTDSAFVIMNPD